MGSKPIVEEDRIEQTLRKMPDEAFTVLDFMKAFMVLCPDEWETLKERFGLFGSKRRYTVATYLSNRLDVYSQKPHSILIPFTRYRQAKFKDYQKTTYEERKVFGSPWIAAFRKRKT